MGVQSARVQQAVVGDDLVFTHTIIKPAVIGNNEGPALVSVVNSDVVKAIYEAKQSDNPADPVVPPVESTGVIVGSYPGSTFTFPVLAAASATMKPGQDLTVRIEVTHSGGAKESFYLFKEYDLLARGFPTERESLDLP